MFKCRHDRVIIASYASSFYLNLHQRITLDQCDSFLNDGYQLSIYIFSSLWASYIPDANGLLESLVSMRLRHLLDNL